MAAGVHLSSLRGPFVFDDEALVDRTITSSYSQAVYQSSLNRKIPFVSFAFSRVLSGWDTWGWHLPNILLHAAASLLVWRWLLALGWLPPLGCWFGAALFALHPVQTMTVSYIYQRSTLFAACFMLGAALCHLQAVRRGDNRWLLGIVFCAALSALSKETALALPFLLWLQEKAARRAGSRLRIGLISVLAGAYSLIVAVRLMQTGGVRAMYPVPANLEVDWPQHLMTQVMVWPLYLLRWVWPFYQNADPDISFVLNPFDARWIGAVIFWTCLAAVVWRIRERQPAVAFGLGWFGIALAPELLGIRDAFFEHRIYLASAGLSLAVCAVFWSGAKRFLGERTLRRRFMILLGAVVLSVLAVATVARNKVWSSEILFWRDVTQKSPGKARGHLNLGAAYDRAGDLQKAKECFELVLKTGPDASRVKALSNLGMIAVREGEYHRGLRQLRAATRMSPSYQRHFFFAGLAMEKIGQYRAACHWYRRTALIRDSESCFQWQAANNLANLLLRLRRLDEAERWIRLGLRLRPGEPILLLNQRNLEKIRAAAQ